MDTVRVLAPAKVNLFLGVGGVRLDGYHTVSTVLHTLQLADELALTPASSLSLTCTPDVGVPAQGNLAWRAAHALGIAFGRTPEVAIELRKVIPHGAGLGGGSSDAAAVIAGLATVWDEDPLDPRCLAVARSLGADVPFFLLGGAALMSGRGDVFERHLPTLDAPVVVVKPDASVSTAAAYRAFDAAPVPSGSSDGVVEALRAADATKLGAAMDNNLAAVATNLVPEVGNVVAQLQASEGVLGACVAGSGSAVFAICDDDADVESMAERARERGWWAVATRLGDSGVEVSYGSESE